jgi:hypothetical protein
LIFGRNMVVPFGWAATPIILSAPQHIETGHFTVVGRSLHHDQGAAMPRAHKKPVQILAASPAMVAAMIGLRPDDLKRGIIAGTLPSYVIGNRRRVVVKDAMKWLRSQRTSKRRKPQNADA